jgi:hypothetical protein
MEIVGQARTADDCRARAGYYESVNIMAVVISNSYVATIPLRRSDSGNVLICRYGL